MKKILFFLAFLALGILSSVESEAQNTMTTASYSPWNLDTTYFTGTTNAGIATGFSKSFSVASNMSAIIQVKIVGRAETPTSGHIKLWGSMDNSTWVAVPLSSASSPGGVGRSSTYTFGGTYPAVTVPAITSAQAIAALPIVADTVAIGAAPAAASAMDFTVAINTPLYTYYRLGYMLAGSANTNEKKTTFFARYYFRKPY